MAHREPQQGPHRELHRECQTTTPIAGRTTPKRSNQEKQLCQAEQLGHIKPKSQHKYALRKIIFIALTVLYTLGSTQTTQAESPYQPNPNCYTHNPPPETHADPAPRRHLALHSGRPPSTPPKSTSALDPVPSPHRPQLHHSDRRSSLQTPLRRNKPPTASNTTSPPDLRTPWPPCRLHSPNSHPATQAHSGLTTTQNTTSQRSSDANTTFRYPQTLSSCNHSLSRLHTHTKLPSSNTT